MSDIYDGISTSKDLEKIFDALVKDRLEAYKSIDTMFLTPALQAQYTKAILNMTKEKIKEEKIKTLKKEDLLKLPLNERYVLKKIDTDGYDKKTYFIITPGIINSHTKEDQIVLRFEVSSFLGCCGSSIIGNMTYYDNNLLSDNKEDKEFIMNLMLETPTTNNTVLTDTTDITEDDSLFELIEIAQPELKPIESYFNGNSGNTVIIYSYNKVK